MRSRLSSPGFERLLDDMLRERRRAIRWRAVAVGGWLCAIVLVAALVAGT